ncbi:urease accessory protein UreD [Aestuariibius sp. 2305UL40-4]|uniref:urease accessory protein UreD n=1 Tax=Aestuariibius violaceus TaxID=3234132 RepID=UPI00345EA266
MRFGAGGLEHLRQSGSFKALFPRGTDPEEIVGLNTAGGMTGGDRFEVVLSVGDGAAVRYTTQAAERAYRAIGGQVATAVSRLEVAGDGCLHWLPQETILYEGSALDRRFEVDLSADATLIAVETLVFGRRAMGEVPQKLRFRDQWRVRVDGALVFADAVRLDDAITQMDRPVIAGGAGAAAQVLAVTPKAEGLARIPAPEGGAVNLIRPGVLFGRVLAEDGFALRKVLVPYLEKLTGRPVPKVWRL